VSTHTIDIAGLDGGTVSVSLDSLATNLAGPILQPGDDGWDDAVLIWNGMAASTPAVVVRPTSSTDVATIVRFAADHGLRLAVKGGGHNIAGTALAERGLNLDMSLMRDVQVDPIAKQARVGAGCLLRHVDGATQEHGLAAVLGFVSETGVAGLTLGGGFGYLTRRFGWTVDNLEEAEVVTADGVVRTASRDENADLFWGLRGGGGNLGVVTRFTYRLYEVGPSITGGMIAWSADRTDEVLAAYRELTETAPRECSAFCTIRLAPPAPFLPPEWHGKPIAAIVVCHSGPDPEDDLAAVRALGDPIADIIMEKPYTSQQSMFDASQPKGAHYYWKNEFVGPQSTEFLHTFGSAAAGVTSPMSQSAIFHLAGRLNEFADDDGAVGNRNAHYFVAFAGAWPATDERGSDHVAWVRRSWEAIRPFSTGGSYVNFQLADEDATRTAASYGANLERLQQVKASYDPYNLFRVNRNVSPARA
jgi:FAD/FMN-containing dehydrogenase